MPWDTPVEPRYLPYGTALAAICALAAVLAVLFATEALRRRLPAPPRAALLLLGFGGACAAGLAWLVGAVGPGHPPWDLRGAALLRSAGASLGPLLQALALAGSFPVLLGLLFLLFGWEAGRGRWRR
ncbi:MAG TPA: hypothetical protein VHI93_06585 [Candidatus Thermoplasmatota archaeon]|nr:hypothetical protein [Candidatus Thermoplasmatota archaeon]